MPWMVKWPGGSRLRPVAHGATLRDVDGHEYVDFCLGDTGAMTGHAPAATVARCARSWARGLTSMLPSEDALVVSEELARRFGLPHGSSRSARPTPTGTSSGYAQTRHRTPEGARLQPLLPRHGRRVASRRSSTGEVVARAGSLGPPVDPELTTRVVEFNDVEALERELARGRRGLRAHRAGADQHRHRAPRARLPRGAARADRGGTGRFCSSTRRTRSASAPAAIRAATGSSRTCWSWASRSAAGSRPPLSGCDEVAARIARVFDRDFAGMGGVGGTLAANAVSMTAMRATLTRGPDR